MGTLIADGMNHLREKGLVETVEATLRFVGLVLLRRYYARRIVRTARAVGSDLRVKGPTRVTPETVLGDNVHFNGMTIRGGGTVTIGDNFHSGSGCEIHSENHNFDDGDAIPFDDTYVCEDVTVGDNVWFGSRVIVLPGVTIEEGAIIQAGSTVTDDVPKGAIAGGHPAEVFGSRDMDHYETLKSEGKFH